MAPPKFGDLGKASKDLLGKDYHHPMTKVEMNSKAQGLTFKATVDKNNSANAVKGNFETKFAYAPLNATITEKFNTSNVLSQVVSFAERGYKLDVDTAYALEKGAFNAKVTCESTQDKYHAHAVMDLSARTVVGSSVFAYENLLFGAQSVFDSNAGSMRGHLASIGYTAKGAIFHALTNFDDNLTASCHHQCSDKLKAAVNVAVSKAKTGEMTNKFNLGVHYALDSSAYLKAKVDNNALIGLSFTQAINPKVKFGLSMMLDAHNMNADTQKVGISLIMNA